MLYILLSLNRHGKNILPRLRNVTRLRQELRNFSGRVAAIGDYAQCMQTWCGNDDFFYCHWVAESEDDVYSQLDAFELEGIVVNSRVSERYQFVSAYRASDEVIRQYPNEGDKW